MPYHPTNSFSMQTSASSLPGAAADPSSFGVDASNFQVIDSGTRTVWTKTKWKAIAAQLESKLRPWVLQYAKLSEEQMTEVVRDAITIENLDSDNHWFKKRVVKVRTNQSTWKNRTLRAIQVSLNVAKAKVFFLAR